MPRSTQGVEMFTDLVDGCLSGSCFRNKSASLSDLRRPETLRVEFTHWTGSGEQHASVSVNIII